ncbi:MAG: class I SAM-dependent methyltransferase [Bacteroidales bacterium]
MNLTPTAWSDYELIDSGNFEKLERFGEYTLIRPEPQALWEKSLPENQWKAKSNAKFIYKTANSGFWEKSSRMPDEWVMKYSPQAISFKCKLTGFKHVGVFPEQAVNWDYIRLQLSAMQTPEPRFLNLFAYTGIASVAAKVGKTQVTHVDSVKQVNLWAGENLALSNKKDIRWITEDARKFVAKEIKRGATYNGIIMDPPAYGIGTNKENWKLERDLLALLYDVEKILDKKEYFFILNTYSLNFSTMILENLIENIFKAYTAKKEYGELYLQDAYGKKIPLGVFARFSNVV